MTTPLPSHPDVRSALLALRDQARFFAGAAALAQAVDEEPDAPQLGPPLARAVGAALRAIVDGYSWPDQAMAGADGAHAAAELLLLADVDAAFVQRCLELMTRCVDDGQLDRADVELVRDHLLLIEHGIQRQARFAAMGPEGLEPRPVVSDEGAT